MVLPFITNLKRLETPPRAVLYWLVAAVCYTLFAPWSTAKSPGTTSSFTQGALVREQAAGQQVAARPPQTSGPRAALSTAYAGALGTVLAVMLGVVADEALEPPHEGTEEVPPTQPAPPPTQPPSQEAHAPLYGVVQSDPQRVLSDRQAGIGARTLDLAWDAYETADGVWNEAYLEAKRREYGAAVAAGFEVVLDLGLQYPPAWLLEQPDSRFIDQHGTPFVSEEPGSSQINAVFNQRMRDYQARYVRQVFAGLGAQPFAVRLGWGWYGEFGYPPTADGANSYWAFDAAAQGAAPGLPAGMQPSPVPGWRPLPPGTPPTPELQEDARRFLEWYLDSLTHYHGWQIALMREMYGGRLFMLYPSFGVRPGQLEAAVQGGLAGQTAPELNAEIQRGFDFARFVADIRDPLVAPYTTWLDADGWFVNDLVANPKYWSPVHYLSELARAHPLELELWGENTGNNSLEALYTCFVRVRQFGLRGMFWAFNGDLYEGGEVSVDDYGRFISSEQRLAEDRREPSGAHND